MTDKDLCLLLCTNGFSASRPALDYGIWLAGVLKLPVRLLGVVERPSQLGKVEALLRETALRLSAVNIPNQSLIDRGRGSVVIARHASRGNFITVVGPLGRPTWRRVVQGRSFRRLLSRIETPILYVREAQLPIKRILLCMGGLGYADSVKTMCLQLAQLTGAAMTVLHVVEPVTLDYPLAKMLQNNWQDVLQTDTPQGRNLRMAMEHLQGEGVQTDFKVRQGSAVHEILSEVHQGEYDLLGLGSPYSAHSLRHLYLPNVTAEVAERVRCPVLTVRLGHDMVALGEVTGN